MFNSILQGKTLDSVLLHNVGDRAPLPEPPTGIDQLVVVILGLIEQTSGETKPTNSFHISRPFRDEPPVQGPTEYDS